MPLALATLEKELNSCEIKLLAFSPQGGAGDLTEQHRAAFLIFSHLTITNSARSLSTCAILLCIFLYISSLVHIYLRRKRWLFSTVTEYQYRLPKRVYWKISILQTKSALTFHVEIINI